MRKLTDHELRDLLDKEQKRLEDLQSQQSALLLKDGSIHEYLHLRVLIEDSMDEIRFLQRQLHPNVPDWMFDKIESE